MGLRKLAGQKTYWHLLDAKKKPSAYEIASTRLHYYPALGFGVSTPVGEWYAQHQFDSASDSLPRPVSMIAGHACSFADEISSIPVPSGSIRSAISTSTFSCCSAVLADAIDETAVTLRSGACSRNARVISTTSALVVFNERHVFH